jgi:hypothetical protein
MPDFELSIALRLSRPSAIFHFLSNDEMLAEMHNKMQRKRATTIRALGSARVSRAGNRVLAVADFLIPRRTSLVSGPSEVRFGEDAETRHARRVRYPECRSSALISFFKSAETRCRAK